MINCLQTDLLAQCLLRQCPGKSVSFRSHMGPNHDAIMRIFIEALLYTNASSTRIIPSVSEVFIV